MLNPFAALFRERVPDEVKELVGPVQGWEVNERFAKRFLVERGLQRDQTLLDVGCGVLRAGIPMIRYLKRGGYFGFDVDEKLVRIGQGRIEHNRLQGKAPTVWCASVATAAQQELPPIDVVFAHSVFIHLSDELLAGCLELIAGCLADDGVTYANVNVSRMEPHRWRSFPSLGRPKEAYEQAARRVGLVPSWLEMKPFEREKWFRHECLVLRRN